MRKFDGFNRAKWQWAIGLTLLLVIPSILLFQNFTRTSYIYYDEALGACVGPDNQGKKAIGVQSKNPLAQCGLWIGGELSRRDFHGFSFTGTTLLGTLATGINAEGAQLKGVTAQQAQLGGSNFTSASIQQTEFHDSNLSSSNFSGSKIENSSFNRQIAGTSSLMSGAGANFQQAKLERVAFWGVDLKGANFKGSQINYGARDLTVHSKKYTALFERVTAVGGQFQNTSLAGPMTDVVFQDADFSGAKVTTSLCGQLNFGHSNWSHSQLSITELGANCGAKTHLSFSKANLQGARLTVGRVEAPIQFDSADLRGADMSSLRQLRTLTKMVSFRGAVFNSQTRLPFDENIARSLGMRKIH